jgi:hypothetical protein
MKSPGVRSVGLTCAAKCEACFPCPAGLIIVHRASRMPVCPNCGSSSLIRVHRNYLQRIAYRIRFRCRQCGFQYGKVHIRLLVLYRFISSRYSRCIRCGTDSVYRSAKRDLVDGPSDSPFNKLCQMMRVPLNKCPACRLQYYDWRLPHPDQDQIPEFSKADYGDDAIEADGRSSNL